jgi:hypothetical protein
MFGTETLLCFGFFILGSLGLFALFAWTDNDMIEDADRRARTQK